eukprot:jgi/Tetstr1/429216/TSEL_019168.t1
MERFMRAGEYMMTSCYPPPIICYPQVRVLVFKATCPDSSGISRKAHLAAMGSLRSRNPDRRWSYEPRRYGRRGRIKEPIGIHGTVKCIFDGPVQQRGSVFVSLHKRPFPKWPQQMTFA